MLFSLAEIVRAVVGSESSVVCSAFFFFFPLVGLEYGAVDEDDGREKGKKGRASALNKMAPLVCFKCSSCM